MFSKFNYTPENAFYNSELNKYVQTGREIYDEYQAKSHKVLKQFIHENGVVNGSKLKEHWFLTEKFDVFLSHSHKDVEKIKGLAGWLYANFGLKSFIDSCSWGYCDDLLKDIDDMYCKNSSSNTYNYELRNYTTAHVHIMLSAALTEMIDNCECIIFFNTPNSITLSKELENVKHSKSETLSPWIYHELSMTSMLRRQIPVRYNNFEHVDVALAESRSEIKISYDVSQYLSVMHTLNDDHLKKWKESSSKKGEDALTALYQIVNKS